MGHETQGWSRTESSYAECEIVSAEAGSEDKGLMTMRQSRRRGMTGENMRQMSGGADRGGAERARKAEGGGADVHSFTDCPADRDWRTSGCIQHLRL